MRQAFAVLCVLAAALVSMAPAPNDPVAPRTYRAGPPPPAAAQVPPPAAAPAPVALAEPVPLPRPRPLPDGMNNLGVPTMGFGPEPLPLTTCFKALTADLATAEPAIPIAQPHSCDAIDAVRLSAVKIGNRRLTMSPPVTLRCDMAAALATWLRDDVMPTVEALGAQLAGLENYEAFECRGMNRVPGAKTSEHGRANALDIRAVRLGDGRRLELTDPEVDKDFRETMRTKACERFSTVLGPGSDGYHESHIHVDLAARRNGYKICQWDVRVPFVPLPRPRPAEAPQREEEL